VLIILDVARAPLMGSVPAAVLGCLTVGQLFTLALVVGAFDVAWMTAYRSYVPNVVAPAHLDPAPHCCRLPSSSVRWRFPWS
jgi:hypothetical protein